MQRLQGISVALFQKADGNHSCTYINNVRAQRAYFELKNTSHNLTQIAMNNGFSGVRTMNRAFDKLYGKTASQIKRNFKN
ncbi:helix-turn-helix domain-containing protein [Lactobacillus amylovorus]|uniref:helix-turn-helix domain-containing protein n=1 Tax=Lactobacillus amylovorus TaxID=1604 RepID=UPI00201D6A7B|nr:helix-turn-helix domain-containing protein [Lactobacillus amylovorus]